MAIDTVTDGKPSRARKSTWPWLVLACLAALIWAAASAGQYEPSPHLAGSGALAENMRKGEMEGYVAASAGLASLIVWAILYFAVLRNSGRKVGFKYFVIVLLVATPGAWLSARVAIGRQALDAKAALSTIINEEYKANSAARDAMQAEIAATGFNEILTPAKLQSDPGLRRAKQAVAETRGILARYRDDAQQSFQRHRLRVAAIDVPPAEKADLMKGFDEGLARSQARMARLQRLQDETLEIHAGLIDLLARRKGSWEVRGDAVLFDSGADAEAFEKLRLRLVENEANQNREIEANNKRQQELRGKLEEEGLKPPPP